MSEENDVKDADLSGLPAERLIEMLRDKRKAEASLRQRLRDAEASRDAAVEQVRSWQGTQFADLAREAGVVDTALGDVAGLVDVGSLLTDDGLVDGGKVADALKTLRTERPHLFAVAPGSTAIGGGGFRGDTLTPDPVAPTWGDVLHAAR